MEGANGVQGLDGVFCRRLLRDVAGNRTNPRVERSRRVALRLREFADRAFYLAQLRRRAGEPPTKPIDHARASARRPPRTRVDARANRTTRSAACDQIG
jgi:hypothetical protein